MRSWQGCLIVICFLPLQSWAGQPSPSSSNAAAERAARAAARESRARVAASYASAKKSAQGNYLSSLSQTIKWLVTLDAKEPATAILGEMRDVDDEYTNLKSLESLVASVVAPKPLDDARKRELDARLLSARRSRSSDLTRLARTCYEAGLMEYAYDEMWEALRCDPDNNTCRTAIGSEHVGKEWVTRYAARQMQLGNVYCHEVGWVPKASLDRYKNGEWNEAGKWMTMIDADKVHADAANPWTIETENFMLKSTAPRARAMEVAERLEATRELCYHAYLEYFMRGSKSRGAQLLFNAPSEKKLVVWYFGSKNGYIAFLNTIPRATDLLKRSAGFYMSDQHASFFYYDPNFGPFQLTVMQHEVTHQILGEYMSMDRAHLPWLAEGVAVVLEHGQPGADGRLSLASGYEHVDIATAARALKEGKLRPASELMSLKPEQFHAEPGRRGNYEESGALCRFIMDYKNGSYANDFMDYLYDCYKGGSANLADYIGMEPAEIDAAFKAYLSNYKAPVLKAEISRQVAPSTQGDTTGSDGLRHGPGGVNPFVRRDD